MHSEGHIGLGMLFYAPVAFALTYFDLMSVLALGLVCAVFFSYAPDFDMQLPLVSHRGATHTLLAGAVASSGVAVLAGYLAISGSYPIDTHGVVLAGATFGAAFLDFPRLRIRTISTSYWFGAFRADNRSQTVKPAIMLRTHNESPRCNHRTDSTR